MFVSPTDFDTDLKIFPNGLKNNGCFAPRASQSRYSELPKAASTASFTCIANDDTGNSLRTRIHGKSFDCERSLAIAEKSVSSYWFKRRRRLTSSTVISREECPWQRRIQVPGSTRTAPRQKTDRRLIDAGTRNLGLCNSRCRHRHQT